MKAEWWDEQRDQGLYFKAENRPTITSITWATAFACLCTLFAELSEEAEAGDGRPGENDGVLARDVLAELLGHEAVELRLVLQRGEAVCALAVLQMDRDLQSEEGKRTRLTVRRRIYVL